MKNTTIEFNGFRKEAFEFLEKLEKDRYNNTEWFSKNRTIYDLHIVKPAKSFVQSISQFFNHLNPSIRTEPKFNKTLMRINKDMRFTKGTPYRTYFLIHFGRFKMDSEFYVYLDKTGISYGLFLNNSNEQDLYFNKNSQKHKKNIIDICEKYGINKKFVLYELHQVPDIRQNKFDASRDFHLMSQMKYLLLEKQLGKDKKLIYTPNFLTETIKTFSRLYPLYCFSISPDPLRMVEDFDERMGIAL